MTRQLLVSNIVIIGLFAFPTWGQTVIFVDASANQTPHNGADWCHAYLELHEALGAAGPNTVIRVADGEYRPETAGLGDPREATYHLANDVTIEGGYAGCTAPSPDERDFAAHETILTGDIGVPNQATDNCYHVITASGVNSTAVLDGVTVTGGSGEGAPSQHWGAALFASGASPTIIDCTFRDNTAERGAVVNHGGAPTITRCTFIDNTATSSGGALYNIGPPPVPAATITDCIFDSNYADAAGGAVRNYDRSPTFTGCVFQSNSVRLSGAAVANGGSGTPSFERCVFRQNQINAVFANWSAYGGAMHNEQTVAPTLTSCVFDGNAAIASLPWFSYGGAIANSDSAQLTAVNCTLSDNYAMVAGGLYNENTAVAVVTSAILWNEDAEIVNDASTSVTVNYSAVEDTWPGTGNTTADPMLADLRPQPGSPCINTGDPTYLPAADTDLDGHARLLCGRVDMGAYEAGIGDYDCNQTVDLADFANWPACMTGPEAGPYPAGCEAFDFLFDLDVDLADFAAYQELLAP